MAPEHHTAVRSHACFSDYTRNLEVLLRNAAEQSPPFLSLLRKEGTQDSTGTKDEDGNVSPLDDD